MSTTYFPQPVFGAAAGSRVLAAPPKYIQGPGVLQHVAGFFAASGFSRLGILASQRGHATQAKTIAVQLGAAGTEVVSSVFQGECSLEEIEAQAGSLTSQNIQCLIAVGGGKCVDAGKCIAHRLAVPVVIVPTLASNDAPTSAVSVLYTPAGVASGAEFFPHNPLMVIVDTEVIAAAGERYLVAGMGDAMATWYEARVCQANPAARNILGTRPTLIAGMMGELCANTLYTSGLEAAAAVRAGQVNQALEDVVEANTLLSGIGFESGGLAGAHGYAQGYTTLPHVEAQYLHGEMVAMGVIAQLMLEGDVAEARRVTEFFVQLGLPVHLGQLQLDEAASDQIDSVVAGTLEFAPLQNLQVPVDAAAVKQALLAGSELGRHVSGELGDTAYNRLQAA